jgi:hypothetical protein
MTEDRRNCPDCGEPLHSIRLIDSAGPHPDRELGYAVNEARQDWLRGRFPVAGTVRACMCCSCGRIIL